MSENRPLLHGKAERYARMLREHLPELKERYGVKSLGIFGSYVRGEDKADSDLDVLVEFSTVPSLLEFVGLKLELSDLLNVDVDLVMKRALRPRIGQRIIQEVVQI
jgi:predicted nucleotidyltransferase